MAGATTGIPAGALEGVLVVALEQAVAAPLATARLADAGARVIKIERPEGDFARGYDRAANGQSVFFLWLNRGKESLVLDIKQPDDAALLQRLLAKADVFVQNLAPGAAERAGLGSAALRARNPRLITCDISGYGEVGPYREMKAYDMLVQAESGLASVSGTGEAPGRVGVSACDIGTGLNTVTAVLQGLYARERTGVGCALSVSMFDSMADWMVVPLAHYELTGLVMERTGLRHPLVCPYGAFPVQGGGQLLIAVQNEREWQRLCRKVWERPDWAEDPRYADNVARVAHRDVLEADIRLAMLAWPREELEGRLREHQIAYGAINTVRELTNHPALRRIEVHTEAGVFQFPAPPVQVRGAEFRAGAVPALGEHSAAIRAEFSA